MSFHDATYLVGIGIDDAGETVTHAVIKRNLGPWAGPWPGGAVVALEREHAGADLVPAIDRYYHRIDRGDEWDRSVAFVFDASSYTHGAALLEAWRRSRVARMRIPCDFLAVTGEENRSRVRGIGRVPWQQMSEQLALLRRKALIKVAAVPLAAELEQQFQAARKSPLRADQDGYAGTDLLRAVALPAWRAVVNAGSVGRVLDVKWIATAEGAR